MFIRYEAFNGEECLSQNADLIGMSISLIRSGHQRVGLSYIIYFI